MTQRYSFYDTCRNRKILQKVQSKTNAPFILCIEHSAFDVLQIIKTVMFEKVGPSTFCPEKYNNKIFKSFLFYLNLFLVQDNIKFCEILKKLELTILHV